MPRKSGRPPLDPDDRSVQIALKVPSKQYDALWHEAQRARMTMPELIRHKLRRMPPLDEKKS